MNHCIETEIQYYEEQLKDAMLHSDISQLDKLLSPELVFTNHLGHIMSKQDDLEAHRLKLFNISEITQTDQLIKIYDNIAIVTVKAHIVANFKGSESANYFRFTRVWTKDLNKTWRITVGHASLVS